MILNWLHLLASHQISQIMHLLLNAVLFNLIVVVLHQILIYLQLHLVLSNPMLFLNNLISQFQNLIHSPQHFSLFLFLCQLKFLLKFNLHHIPQVFLSLSIEFQWYLCLWRSKALRLILLKLRLRAACKVWTSRLTAILILQDGSTLLIKQLGIGFHVFLHQVMLLHHLARTLRRPYLLSLLLEFIHHLYLLLSSFLTPIMRKVTKMMIYLISIISRLNLSLKVTILESLLSSICSRVF